MLVIERVNECELSHKDLPEAALHLGAGTALSESPYP